MGSLGRKLRHVERCCGDGAGRVLGGHAHWCPGCLAMHVIPDTWQFNGDVENPSFYPSVKHQHGQAGRNGVCHYLLTDGKLSFCPDSTHALSGQTVDLPDLPVENQDAPR